MDVTTLDVYKKSGDGKPYINVTTAKEDKLLGKWYTIKEAYVEAASKFDKDGNRLDETVDKLHLEFEEIDHKFTLNKPNFNTLVKDFGTESDDWVGEFVKLRITTYPNGTKGVIIPSRQDLKDEGETPPTKASKDDKDLIKTAMKESGAVKTAVERLRDFDEDITVKNVINELGDLKEKNDITNKAYSQALDALEAE
ncbi:MAG: hypothetical protein A4E27_00174 [Methanobacterium sp. PtaU1.Bin242]|jgi:hypothetical protein|nr:MAG: hypothetical protein A4E27_00174 [Methanobacterium sp. PtaU1.Bin242]